MRINCVFDLSFYYTDKQGNLRRATAQGGALEAYTIAEGGLMVEVPGEPGYMYHFTTTPDRHYNEEAPLMLGPGSSPSTRTLRQEYLLQHEYAELEEVCEESEATLEADQELAAALLAAGFTDELVDEAQEEVEEQTAEAVEAATTAD